MILAVSVNLSSHRASAVHIDGAVGVCGALGRGEIVAMRVVENGLMVVSIMSYMMGVVMVCAVTVAAKHRVNEIEASAYESYDLILFDL